MVNDENKYWFENDGKEKPEVSKPAPEAKEEDLFGFGGASPDFSADFSRNSFSKNEGASVGDSFSALRQEGQTPPPYDPHERHYRSDFAQRSEGAPKEIKNGENTKAVRGPMLKKLLKYDYRALFKFLLPAYIVLLALAALCAICLPIAQKIAESNAHNAGVNAFMSALGTIVMLYAFGVLCCSTVCIFNIAIRFQKNLFTGEGYLTLSIPATPEEHIFSKIISGFTTVLLTLVVAIGSMFIVAAPYGEYIFPALGEFFTEVGVLFEAYPVDASFFLIELILFCLLWLAFEMEAIYSCLCIGHMFVNKSRAGAAVVAFVIYTAVGQTISVFITATGALSSVFNSLAGIHIFFWVLIMLLAAGIVGLFFFQKHVLRNKVNLG